MNYVAVQVGHLQRMLDLGSVGQLGVERDGGFPLAVSRVVFLPGTDDERERVKI